MCIRDSIYSDLMVPPLVMVNTRYYGAKVALYIAGVMYVSIVATALILDGAFGLLDVTPESGRVMEEVSRFAVDYTFWLNLIGVGLAVLLVWLNRRFQARQEGHGGHDHGGGRIKGAFARLAILVWAGGGASWLFLALHG